MSLVSESPGNLSATRGKSWNLVGNDADRRHTDADADVKIFMSTHLCSTALCYFFTTCDSDECSVWMLLSYCVVSNCCLSLYLNVAGLRQRPGKMLPRSWKVLEFFVTVGV